MSNVLRANNIFKSFGGVKALKDVSLEINRGEILCLVGENGCGKSTLVKILSGVYHADSGEIIMEDKVFQHLSPIEAIHHGIQVIFQDLSLFPHMSVEDNIAMSHMVTDNKPLVSRADNRTLAAKQLERIRVELDLDTKVADLSVANRQIVAICRALSMNAKILFMDEPTTALTRQEIDSLLAIAQELKKQGVSIVFISHKLDEIFQIADRITVLRDGCKVGDFDPAELDELSLAFHMTGREIVNRRFYKGTAGEKVLLRTKNLSRNGMYSDINLELREGEVIGMIGSLGAGRTEVALSLFGLNQPDQGEVEINGETVNVQNPSDAVSRHLALVPEDRLSQGLFLGKDIRTNLTAAILSDFFQGSPFVDAKKQDGHSREMVEKVNVNIKDVDLLVQKLSGGNQQKVVIGKWLSSDPSIFILDAPTVGVDIGSKAEIYEIIQDVAATGCGIMILSDEINEVLANCNRIYVFRSGRIVHEFGEREIEADDIREKLSSVLYGEENADAS
jgi:simple sugar transport system ATP-binding protein